MFTSALPRCSLTLHARPPGVRVKASLYLVSFDPGARLPSEPPRPVQASLPLWRRKKNVLASDDKQRMLFGLLLHNLTSTWSHVCSGPEVWVKHSFLIPVYVYDVTCQSDVDGRHCYIYNVVFYHQISISAQFYVLDSRSCVNLCWRVLEISLLGRGRMLCFIFHVCFSF